MPLRPVLAGVLVLLLGALVIRTAVVREFAEGQPETAARLWPEHPEVLKSLALASVARAAARSQDPPRELARELAKLSERAPLGPEPFLIEGSIASKAGDYKRAEALLAAAVRRDPRSLAGRYLLADLYLQQNRVGPALDQISLLARLSPSFARGLLPALAQFAQSPGAAPEVRRSLRSNPQFANELLESLASDPRNAKLVLYLASALPPSSNLQPWQQKLLSTLVQSGNYEMAYDLWRRFDRASLHSNEFAFSRPTGPSPFSWTFSQEADAAAEPVNGALHVAFSGNQTTVLASKIARLASGNYELRFTASGPADSVDWKVSCLPGNAVLWSQPIGQSSLKVTANFRVPDGCKAQKFDLTGEAQTMPSPTEFTITDLDVRRAGNP